MADNSSYRQNQPARIADDDPFAELTRIMGFDPRVKVTPQPPEPDFGIDLERELLGEFEREFTQPQEPQAIPSQAVAPFEPEADLSVAFDQALADDGLSAEPVFADAPIDPVDWAPNAVLAEEPVADEMSAQLQTSFDADVAAGETVEEPTSDTTTWYDDLEFAETDAQHEIAAASDWRDQPLQWAGQVETGQSDAHPDTGADVTAAEAGDIEEAPALLPIELDGRGAGKIDPHAPAAFDDFSDLDLGSNYKASADRPDPKNLAEQPLDLAASEQAHEEEAWTSYDPSLAPEPDEPELTDFAAPAEKAAAVEAEPSAPEPLDMEDPAMQPFDERAFDTALADELAIDPNEGQSQWDGQQAASAAPVSPPIHAAARPLVQGMWNRPRATMTAPAMHADVPDIETVDFVDNRVAHSDKLDLPEVPHAQGWAPAPEYDDFDTEFASAYNALHDERPAAREAVRAPAYAPRPAEQRIQASAFDYGDDMRAADTGYAPASGHHGVSTLSNAGLYEPQDEDDHGHQQTGFAALPALRRRGFVLAGAVAALALVGGVAVFALSGGGDQASGPVLVRAESDPIKVRPENPGGTSVPNQENVAYDRVGSGQPLATPTQARLISSEEEPVDLSLQESAAPLDGLAALGIGEKGEDRLEPEMVGTAETAPVEMIAVPPRKVRTMIVKPDGTLVARAETAEPETGMQMAAIEPPTGTVSAPDQSLQPPADAVLPDPVQAAIEDAPPAVESAPAVTETAVAAVEPAPEPVAAASPPSGWSIQIASQPSAADAQASYDSLVRRYARVLDGKGVNIVKAEVAGKGTYYRVRIPTGSRAEANSLCSSYKSAGGSCFVTQ